tara:strand:+ start:1755 stop:2009 length:255 start_codon:yes stop_codon:yes gene_type:complete
MKKSELKKLIRELIKEQRMQKPGVGGGIKAPRLKGPMSLQPADTNNLFVEPCMNMAGQQLPSCDACPPMNICINANGIAYIIPN